MLSTSQPAAVDFSSPSKPLPSPCMFVLSLFHNYCICYWHVCLSVGQPVCVCVVIHLGVFVCRRICLNSPCLYVCLSVRLCRSTDEVFDPLPASEPYNCHSLNGCLKKVSPSTPLYNIHTTLLYTSSLCI